MNAATAVNAALGGALVGIAAGALLLLNGRIAGVSGMVAGLLRPRPGEVAWRAAFVGGLIAGGAALALFHPEALPRAMTVPWPLLLAAGFAVGVGTRLANGCTSGHGLCGTGRLSVRSIVATCTFISAGVATVAAGRYFGVFA